jgi:hypothetical protein
MFGVKGGELKGPTPDNLLRHSPTQNLHEVLWAKDSQN